jgi:hypothetical protein
VIAKAVQDYQFEKLKGESVCIDEAKKSFTTRRARPGRLKAEVISPILSLFQLAIRGETSRSISEISH